MEEAKEIMGSEEDYVILNVQTQEEYDQGHIPGAVLIPNTEIEARAEEELYTASWSFLVVGPQAVRSIAARRRKISFFMVSTPNKFPNSFSSAAVFSRSGSSLHTTLQSQNHNDLGRVNFPCSHFLQPDSEVMLPVLG